MVQWLFRVRKRVNKIEEHFFLDNYIAENNLRAIMPAGRGFSQ